MAVGLSNYDELATVDHDHDSGDYDDAVTSRRRVTTHTICVREAGLIRKPRKVMLSKQLIQAMTSKSLKQVFFHARQKNNKEN